MNPDLVVELKKAMGFSEKSRCCMKCIFAKEVDRERYDPIMRLDYACLFNAQFGEMLVNGDSYCEKFKTREK